MRITCVIDSLSSGGAQRQMVMLAVLLKERAHDVRLLTYHDNNFFKYILDNANIPVECVFRRFKIFRFFALRLLHAWVGGLKLYVLDGNR